MPDVRMPNGTVIRNVPAGTSKAQLLAKLRRNGVDTAELLVPPQEENTLEKIPLIGGLAAGIADLPLEAASMLAGVGKAGAEAFGADNAVSDFFGGIAEGARDWKSSGAREDAMASQIDQQMAEGRGTWEELKAAGRSFLRSPLETTAGVAGSAIPFIAAGALTGGAAVPALMGAAIGAGTIKGEIQDAVYNEFKKAGASEEQALAAAEKAQEYSGENLDQIGFGTVLGAVASATGFAPAIAKTIGARASARVAERIAAREAAEAAGEEIARKSLAKGAAKGVITEAVPEAVQAGQEKYSQNMALRREGFDVDPWAGVAGQAAAEGIASIILGGYGGVRETQQENAGATAKQYAAKVEALPDDPTEDDVAPIAEWAVRRGFSEEEASIIAKNAAEQKARVARAKADAEEALKKTREMRTANVEPIFEPDIGAPPPVDAEEQAAMEQAYAAEAGAPPVAPTAPAAPSIIPPLETITPQAQISEQLAAVRPNEVELDAASLNGALKMYGSISARGVKAPEPLVNMLASKLLDASASGQLDAIAASDLGPVVQQFFTNEAATINELATNKAPPASAAPVKAAPQITPDVAQQLIDNIEQRPELQSEIEASTGLTLDDLYDIAEGAQPKYSRGRRPKDTQTEDLFGALPMQEAPGEDLKRDEYNAQRFASDEERAAREQQFAEEMQAGQERALALTQREAEQRDEALGDIEYALRAQAPENAVYRVDYDPTDTNAPYKLVAETQLGKKPEEVLRAKTLQDFSDQVYGRMMELTPYVPAAPAGIEEIEQREPNEQEAPTVATRMVQDFTAEVDAAREAGQIDNAQRSELLQRLQRPNAYRTLPNGREVPNDAIAKLEADALEAASVLRNAPAEEQEAAKAALKEANDKLRAAVKNSLLNPARAKLKSMIEIRQDERVGAKVRIKEAERAERAATRDMRKGMKPGKGVLEADVTPERARVQEAKKEAREAKIDLKESKVQKYRKAERKGRTEASVVQRVVDKITKQWKSTNPVVVVQSISDIPDAKVRRAIQRDGATDAEGLVAPDGTIYLIADNLDGESRAKAVLFHEGLGHVGLEKLFREKLDSVLNALYKGNAKLRAETDAWMKANPDAYKGDVDPLARAVEEVLAERSEAGQLEPSIFNRLASIVRNFARRLGINLALSDADVDAILAAAHERTVNGPNESQLVKGMRYMASKAERAAGKSKTSEADAKKVENADERLSVGARRVEKSFSTAGIADGLGDMSAGRKSKEWAGAMWQNWGLFSPNARKGLLKSMPSSGILGWVKPEFKALHERMQMIDERVHKMNALKQRIIAAGDELAKDIRDFNDEYGTRELAVLMGQARINELDPYAFVDADAALQGDAVMQEIEKNILKNSNDPKASQKLIDDIKAIVMANKDSVKIKGDKYTMSAQLLNLSRALGKASKDQQKSTQHVEQLSEMTRRIRDTYATRAKLDAQRGGARIYKEVRQFYKDMFEAEQALLDERINSIDDPDEAVRIKDMRAKLMREIVSPEERRKGGDLFWDLDADLFQKDYFPFMREGDRWLRVHAAKDGSREREFHTFRTDAELRKAQKEIAERLGVDPEDSNVIEIGYDVGRLQENLRSEDLLMQRVFDIVGKERQKYEASGNINLKELTDAIYQTWLMTTPERSVRRRLMHAEEVVGFSPDVFLHFREQVTTYANQLSKLAYAGQVRLAVEEARGVINDPERPASERAKWRMFVDEFEDRANSEMNPEPQSAVINFLNRNSYYYYLTSAKTALLQVLTIPIRVVPRLWRDYGYAKGTMMWIKYMKMWNSLGRVKTERGASDYGEWLDGIMPNVNGSQFVKNSADLQWALKMGTERGILETLHDTLVQNERATPGKTATGAAKTFEDVRGNIGKTMSFLFNGMENISRQASYYMTFELALEKYRKENPSASDDEARKYAFQQAMDVVRNTAGDFSSWERPSIAKGNLGRAVFLFKMHPITQTRFMVGAMRDMARGTKALVTGGSEADKAEGIGALKELSGVLMMTGMFGGLMGMPLYSAMTYALMAAFGPDDDDDKDVLALMGGDPRVAYDPDIAFRSWMNEKFGDIKIGDMSLADILVSGPVSAATNTELSSATSLDLKNLWWRDAVVGDSLEESMVQTAIANIAGISMVAQVMRGLDSFKEGKIEDGLKKTLPAFFRTWVNAAVNEEQGVKNRRGDVLIDKKDIGAADNIRDVLGFRAPKLSRIQQYYITRAKNESAINAERKAILDRYETAVNNGEIKTAADYEKFKKEEIVPFNRTYPAREFFITDKVVRDSIKRRGQIRARTVEGVQFDKKTTSGEYAAQRRFVQ